MLLKLSRFSANSWPFLNGTINFLAVRFLGYSALFTHKSKLRTGKIDPMGSSGNGPKSNGQGCFDIWVTKRRKTRQTSSMEQKWEMANGHIVSKNKFARDSMLDAMEVFYLAQPWTTCGLHACWLHGARQLTDLWGQKTPKNTKRPIPKWTIAETSCHCLLLAGSWHLPDIECNNHCWSCSSRQEKHLCSTIIFLGSILTFAALICMLCWLDQLGYSLT